MTRNTKKIIIFSILALVIIGAGVAYYLYNKGPVDVKNSTGIKVIAVELYQHYSNDSFAAQKKYTDKILEVSGIAIKISQNQQNQAIILLKTNESAAYVNCTMEGPANTIRENDAVIIKGLCSGIGQGDTDLGIKGDVYLTRCYFIKYN